MGKKRVKIEQYDHESCMVTFPDGETLIQTDREINNMVKLWLKLEAGRNQKPVNIDQYRIVAQTK